MDIKITDYVAEVKPHKYAEVVASLIEAGPDKIAGAEFATEEEALAFVREFQQAAREAGYSGRKRVLEQRGKVFFAGMAVVPKISRPRKVVESA